VDLNSADLLPRRRAKSRKRKAIYRPFSRNGKKKPSLGVEKEGSWSCSPFSPPEREREKGGKRKGKRGRSRFDRCTFEGGGKGKRSHEPLSLPADGERGGGGGEFETRLSNERDLKDPKRSFRGCRKRRLDAEKRGEGKKKGGKKVTWSPSVFFAAFLKEKKKKNNSESKPQETGERKKGRSLASDHPAAKKSGVIGAAGGADGTVREEGRREGEVGLCRPLPLSTRGKRKKKKGLSAGAPDLVAHGGKGRKEKRERKAARALLVRRQRVTKKGKVGRR